MSDADRGRQLRRRHMHERQAAVFGVLLAGLAVVGVGAAAVYTDTVNLSAFDRGFSSPAPTTSAVDRVVCPPAGALPVAYDQVTVNVLNGSGATGVAGLTAENLATRGFVIASTGNGTSFAGTVRLSFGVQGIAAAYTLAAQFTDPTLTFVDRADATVDVTVGKIYDDLVPVADVVLDPAAALTGPEGCVPVEELLAAAATASATPPAAETTAPAEG
ncbi:LytR C-terminal domain-containing protein [Cellulomonas soli]|uniref:LytR/CpsA/Psr regulator C-terminal domain-containing protein n=1 Tax=Cellulomonas soli TaxID=931535 RepID=A0A512PDZ9_9CELL|nr:LytR C-terminal domain-containing protein [Cellulomonas soli]NYI59079.1 hypothetical protein [Cellulomonas soli]GEP69430.1 hypothetical protein CSO01_21450 [Cellulomonas soli]